jgi:hypothetical protein
VTIPPIIPVGIFDKRSYSRRLYSLPPDALDYLLFLPAIWLVCGLGIALRLIGPLFVVIPVGFCLLYAILRLTVPPRLLSAYIAFCIFVAVVSKYQLLPTSWQVHFKEEAIVRQLIPVLGYFSVAWASKAYFRRRLLNGDVFFGAPLIIVLGLVVAPALMLIQGRQYQGDDAEYTVLASYGALINNNLVAIFFVMGGIFLARDWRRYVGLVFVLGIAATTHFAQFRVLTVVVLATLLGVPGRIAVVVLVVTMPCLYAVGISHVPEMMIANPNSGIRLAFVADAISSAIDTHGIGIGYGKESVRWQYEFPNMAVFTFLPDASSMTPDRMLEALSTGVENSFVESLLRTGALGLGLYLAAFFAAFPPPNLPRDVRNHAAIVFAMSFIGCFVNSALESPNSAVGHAFVVGYLLALRASAGRPVMAGLRNPGPLRPRHGLGFTSLQRALTQKGTPNS